MRALRLFLFFLLAAMTAHGAITGGPTTGGPGSFGTATNILNVPLILLPGSPTNNAPQGKVLTPGAGVVLSTNNTTNLVIEVTGGTATNAQPPSANLTNWSTVSTQALRIANTLYVTTNGTDATAAREWAHLQFRTLGHAKTNAEAGDVIVVWPGTYLIDTNLNLAKNGVNWDWKDGATFVRNAGGHAGPELRGVFNDIGAGAMVFSISGHGEGIITNGYSSMFTFTNRGSRVNVVGNNWHNLGTGPLIYHGESDLTVRGYENVRAQNYDTVWSEPADGVASYGSLYVDAPYWYAGDNLWETKAFRTNGACVLSGRYGEAQTLFDGDAMVAGSNVVTVFDAVRTSGYVGVTAGVGRPQYNIKNLELVGNPSAPLIQYGIWLRNCAVYSPGTTTPILMGACEGCSPLLENVSIQTGAPQWVESFDGNGGFVTNNGFFRVNGKLPASDVRVISHLASGFSFSITNQIGVIALHETNTSFAVQLRAADNLTNNFTLILPTNHPIAGQVVSVRAVSGQNYSLTWSNDAGSAVTGPYILFTNGHGTNASFWDGLKVDGDGMTNAGPYRGKYVLSDIGTVNAANSTNIGATAVWNETDEIFSAVNIKAVDNAAASESSALLRLDWDSQGTHQIDWLAATGLQGTYRIRTDGSTHQSGNANVHGTVSTTNLVITNRVTQALKTLAYSGTNVTVDWSQGNHFYLLLTNNAKLWFTNAPGANWSQTGLIDLVQDGTGTRLLYWDSTNIRTNPAQSVVLSTPANAIDDMHVKTDSTGTNFHILLNTGWAK